MHAYFTFGCQLFWHYHLEGLSIEQWVNDGLLEAMAIQLMENYNKQIKNNFK
jgi:hypothetical protein